MVIGMLLAGGIGQRMGANVPKQFLEVNGKPIILYPLEIMENHPLIDVIEIVCVEDYIQQMWELVKSYGFRKVRWIVAGGSTAQDSHRNGISALRDKIKKEDILMIHMSSYPLANAEIMTDCIESARKNGNGCTARPVLFSVYVTDDRKTSTEQIERDKLMLCTIPYAFRYGDICELYDRAYAECKGIVGNVFANTLYCEYGKRIYFTKDSEINMKVTTPEDLVLMEAYLNLTEKTQGGVKNEQ